MVYPRVDLVSLFDLDFVGAPIPSSELDRLQRVDRNAGLADLYRESFSWLFYGETLKGFRRFCLLPPKKDHGSRGSSVLVNPVHGIGVYSVWTTFRGDSHPLQLRHDAWEKSEASLAGLKNLRLSVGEIQRHYPFLALQVESHDLDQYCNDHAEELGRIFTGDYEQEDKGRLRSYVRLNISWRRYEWLLVRWTEALAVYTHDIDEKLYELTFLRAVQLFETCIVIHRSLQSLNQKIDRVSSTLAVYNPWKVNDILGAYRELERSLITAPPVQSVEAGRLLSSAYEGFGIPRMAESAKHSCEFLESRYQWAKTQVLVAVGVLTYILDKLKVFEKLMKL